jgi:hypothetical protein
MQASPFSTSNSKSIMSSSQEFAELQKVTVQSAATGKSIKLGETFPGSGNKKTIVAFFTHFGDFNSFEYAEKLLYYLPEIEKAGVNLVCVGIGNVDAAREFARLVGGFPLDKLYADETAAGYKEFGFSRGFAADVPVNPYLKLLPMLAGIGSPGTLQAVLRGYVGDRKADASWTSRYLNKNNNMVGGESKALVDKSAFDVLGTEGARPFEVATVRLQNMMAILPMWEKLVSSACVCVCVCVCACLGECVSSSLSVDFSFTHSHSLTRLLIYTHIHTHIHTVTGGQEFDHPAGWVRCV